MKINAYQSPSHSSDGGGIGALLLRVFAVGCWFFSLLPVLGFLSIVNRPDMADKWDQSPAIVVCLHLAMFALPSLGFAALGIASWWRLRWIAVVGIAAFLPIILWALAAALWPR